MTSTQASVLAALRDLTVDGVPPNYGEIQTAVGFSSRSQVHRAVQILLREGKVTMTRGSARTLRIVEGPSRAELERWSDAEIRRVTLDLYEIGRARGLGRRVAA